MTTSKKSKHIFLQAISISPKGTKFNFISMFRAIVALPFLYPVGMYFTIRYSKLIWTYYLFNFGVKSIFSQRSGLLWIDWLYINNVLLCLRRLKPIPSKTASLQERRGRSKRQYPILWFLSMYFSYLDSLTAESSLLYRSVVAIIVRNI